VAGRTVAVTAAVALLALGCAHRVRTAVDRDGTVDFSKYAITRMVDTFPPAQ